jgi:hypothetical protein
VVGSPGDAGGGQRAAAAKWADRAVLKALLFLLLVFIFVVRSGLRQ